jgi:hypothetical protein
MYVKGSITKNACHFKVLTSQLKIPHYSLHQVMADAARSDEEERTFHVSGASNASGSGGKVLDESQGESSEL